MVIMEDLRDVTDGFSAVSRNFVVGAGILIR